MDLGRVRVCDTPISSYSDLNFARCQMRRVLRARAAGLNVEEGQLKCIFGAKSS